MESLRAVVNRTQRHLEIVRHVARTLDSDSSSAQVKRGLRRYLNRLRREAPRRGRGAHTGHFVDHLIKLTDSYWPGLFHTYDHPEIPRTSNGIEGFFGSIKRSVRSTTGRASTAGGKMESCAEFAVRAQALAQTMPAATLNSLVESVPDAAFAVGKKALLRIRAPARERRSIQRNLDGFLDRVLAAWHQPAEPG